MHTNKSTFVINIDIPLHCFMLKYLRDRERKRDGRQTTWLNVVKITPRTFKINRIIIIIIDS